MSGKNKIRFTICGLQKWLAGVFVLMAFASSAQTFVSATLRADSTRIMIGDHLNVRLSVTHPKTLKIVMPVVKDSVGNMDFISASKIDTITQATDEVYSQNYVLSAYDSGEFRVGPVPVIFKNSTGKIDTVLSNEFSVSVFTLPVDTNKAFKPIKGPLDVPYSWREFIPEILIGLGIILVILIGIFLWKRYRKNNPVVVTRFVPKEPAHIWARKELKKLEEEKLWQKGEAKLYYSRLADTLRLYLEYRYGWLALESTTEEIEAQMPNYNMKDKAKDIVLNILRLADLVKFAKMLPVPDVNIRAMEQAYKLIDFTEPKEEEPK